MLYTSGTTGNPKGVPLTHRNVGVNGATGCECNAPLLDEGMRRSLLAAHEPHLRLRRGLPRQHLGFTSYLADPATVLAKLPEVRPERVHERAGVSGRSSRMAAASGEDPAERKRALAEAPAGGCASASRAARASSAR
jgi:long-chain acyl-CoA synthetase